MSDVFWWAVWSQTNNFTKSLPLLFQLCLCVLLISLHEITLLHNIISATGVLWACLKVTISIIAVSVKLTVTLARIVNFWDCKFSPWAIITGWEVTAIPFYVIQLSGREPGGIPAENKSTNNNEVRFLINLCLNWAYRMKQRHISLFLSEGHCFILSPWSPTLIKPVGSQYLQYFYLSDKVRWNWQQSSKLLWRWIHRHSEAA